MPLILMPLRARVLQSLRVIVATLVVSSAHADELRVAAAANFADALAQLAAGFQSHTGHQLRTSIGSSGSLYAQISHGAPFDVFLSADQDRPRRLEQDGTAVPGSRFTYAIGRLALWSLTHDITAGPKILATDRVARVAMANPALAPYGRAARQALDHLKLTQAVQHKLVTGQNIGQTHAMVATQNADVGFVALAGVMSPRNTATGSTWIVPEACHAPILQDAVLLQRGADNPAAQAFMLYLRSGAAQRLIGTMGYRESITQVQRTQVQRDQVSGGREQHLD